jgi:WD40 repeat protein
MGLVYRALDEQLKRDVAIKFVRLASGSSTRTLDRFQREAEAVARLQHPNIIQIFTYGSFQPQGQPRISYLVLEFAPGGTLTEKIAGNPQTPAEAAYVTQLLARAVHYAHEKGIIHRDLKPQNVLLTPSPKIADFGLARLTDDNQMLTAENARPGTPCNMSPEQVSGDFPIGPATDIYALGTILYELLTGRPPFKADSRSATLHLVQHERPLPPSRYARGISKDLDAICLKCLAKSPQERYASADQLADDLKAFLELRPTIARPRNIALRATLWTRRHPVPAVLLVIALTVACFWAASLRRYAVDTAQLKSQQATTTKEKEFAYQERESATQEKTEAVAAAEAAEKKRQHHRALSNYAALIQLAHDAWANHQLEPAQALVRGASPEFRGWEWNYLQRLCNDHVLQLDTKAHSLFYTPSGRQLVTVFGPEASVWDAETGRFLSSWKTPDADSKPSPYFPTTWTIKTWMRDGEKCYLIAGNDTNYQMLDVETWNVFHADERRVLSWTNGSPATGLFYDYRRLTPADYVLSAVKALKKLHLHGTQQTTLFDVPYDPSQLNAVAVDLYRMAKLGSKGELEIFSAGGSKRFTIPPQKPPIVKALLFGAENRFITLESEEIPGDSVDPFLEKKQQSGTLPSSVAVPDRQQPRAPLGPNRSRFQLTLRGAVDGKPLLTPVRLQSQANLYEAAFNADYVVISALGRNAEPLVEAFSTRDLTPVGPLHAQHELAPWARLANWQTSTRPFALDDAGLGLLAIGYPDGVIEVWNLKSSVLLRSISTPCQLGIRSLAFSPRGDRLAAIIDKGQVRVWSLSRGQNATVAATPVLRGAGWLGGRSPGIPVSFQWRNAESGRNVSVVGQWRAMADRVRLRCTNWQDHIGKPSGEVFRRLQMLSDKLALVGLDGSAWELPVSSQILSYIISMPDVPQPFAEAENEKRLTVAVIPNANTNRSLRSEGFTDYHLWPQSREDWGSLSVLSIDKADEAAPVTETTIKPESYIAAFAVSKSGDKVAFATTSQLSIYNALTGAEISTLPIESGRLACKLAFNAADDLLAIGFESGGVQVIRLQDSKTVLDEPAHQTPITLLRFSPKGTFLVSAGAPPYSEGADYELIKEAGPAKVWWPTEGKLHFEIPHARPVDDAVSFNSNETRIAVANHHQQLEIWETELGLRLLAFRGHCCAPSAVSFNPADDSMLVSAPKCHSFLYVWSAAEPREVPLEAITLPQ